jgi:hypothetical protein
MAAPMDAEKSPYSVRLRRRHLDLRRQQALKPKFQAEGWIYSRRNPNLRVTPG